MQSVTMLYLAKSCAPRLHLQGVNLAISSCELQLHADTCHDFRLIMATLTPTK